jgi:hypothetical protein
MEDDDDDFREFLKLEKQYFEANIEERERLRPDFERAIEKVLPAFFETHDARSANGDYLKDMVDRCVYRGLARPDLTPYGRINEIEDADDFKALFEIVRKYMHPKWAALIYAMNTASLFIGMRSGHDPDAIEKLSKEVRSELGRPGGKASTKARHKKAERWKTWVTDQAPSMRDKHPTSAQEDLADKLIALALTKKVNVPDRSAVVRHLSALEHSGALPSRTRSRGERTRSRTKPLR